MKKFGKMLGIVLCVVMVLSMAAVTVFAESGSANGACEHDFLVSVLEPECDRWGYTVRVCKLCGYTEACDFQPALGHEITFSSEGFEATCTEDGMIEFYYCGTCNTYFADAELTTPMEDQTGLNLTIPAYGHEISFSSEGFEATCTEDGMIEFYYCGMCNTYFADAELTTLLEDQTGLNLTIPAYGHEIVSSNAGFEATCTEDGMNEYYYCGNCGCYFADAELTTLLEDQTGASLLIPAYGHEITSSCEGFAPTCLEEGMLEYYYCGNCGCYFADAELTTLLEDQTGLNLSIPVGDHVAGEWVVVKEPAVGVDGLKEQRCTVCGEVLAQETIRGEEPPKVGDFTFVLIVMCVFMAAGTGVLVLKKKYF